MFIYYIIFTVILALREIIKTVLECILVLHVLFFFGGGATVDKFKTMVAMFHYLIL